MRQGPLSLLLALSLLAPALHAQESAPSPLPEASEQAEPYADEDVPPAAHATDAVEGLLLRLREENQRLRLQLQAEQAKVAPALLTEQQRWFVVGGGVGVVSFLLGLLVTRDRRRRQWIN
ncbi:hypothetical protein [Pseudomonas lopnurensis]|uniref:hypothetical protein n=1 Tax=Pseudomonas lopnurensis TaxID=1477517 RepID=UPI00187A54E9|nr:hypothetical protein [Pseudomonas lopnurensis]MBE7375550.1 hypothetical protein [Pseudomonas lopnurensis]